MTGLIVFQALVMLSIGLVFVQIKTADCVDKLRRNQTEGYAFRLRRTAMFAKMITLCLTVAYGWKMGWTPWPPFTAFLATFDVYVLANILVMRQDMAKLAIMRGIAKPASIMW